jgi:hypothetical protein
MQWHFLLEHSGGLGEISLTD